MKFFAIHLADLESERFLSASNDQIATWLLLHAFCCKQFNRGIITDAQELGDRFWNRHGINKDILKSPSTLWSWDGSSIIVQPYDIDGQDIYERKAKGGKAGADKRWNRTHKVTPNKNPNRTLNAPKQTRPKQIKSKQSITQPMSLMADEGNLFAADENFDTKKNHLQELVSIIWKNTPPKGRERSSKKQLEEALKKISPKDRPGKDVIFTALKAWKASETWVKDGGQYVAGIHRWVNDRKWDSPPEPATTKQSADLNTGRRISNIEDICI